jgi:hypothetical protein
MLYQTILIAAGRIMDHREDPTTAKKGGRAFYLTLTEIYVSNTLKEDQR